MGKAKPFLAAGIVVTGLSLIGVPGTAGFISKWELVRAIIDKGWLWLAVIMLLSSLVTIVYIWKIIELMYFKKLTVKTNTQIKIPLMMSLSTNLLIFACLFFGLFPSSIIEASESAAIYLFETRN